MGDLPGYTPTLEDLQFQEVYRGGTQLHGGIRDNETWKEWWRDLAVMPSWRYDMPSRKVEQRFVVALVVDLHGVRDRLWNLERFIVFQTAIL